MNANSASPALLNFLRSFADSRTSQSEVLRRVVAKNKNCEFGRRCSFASIQSVSDFRRAVPVSGYEAFRSYIERMWEGEPGVLTSEPVRRFFITSGSMAAPKFIPVTPSFVRDKSYAFQAFWNLVREAYPRVDEGSLIFNFSDTGQEQRTKDGLLCSSESSFWNACWRGAGGKARCPLPREIMNISDAEPRYYTIARIVLEAEVTALMTLNPSTMLLLSEVIHRNSVPLIEDIRHGGISSRVKVTRELREYMRTQFSGNERRAGELENAFGGTGPVPAGRIWPNLQLAVCWRSPMAHPYLELLSPFLGSMPQRDYLTMASEGVMAIPFRDDVNGGILPIHTHFFEFIPAELWNQDDPPTLLAHELEPGKTYVVVLTTSAGLYRYNIGDVVRVTDFNGSTPIVEFLHRAGHTCSLTGEKLTESQVAGAVCAATFRVGIVLKTFTLCPAALPHPHYVLLAEVDAPLSRSLVNRFLAAFDDDLGVRNIEYRSKRSSRRLGPPELWLLPPGSHASLRQQRVVDGANDAQVKIACLTRDFNWHKQFQVLERLSCESLV